MQVFREGERVGGRERERERERDMKKGMHMLESASETNSSKEFLPSPISQSWKLLARSSFCQVF
jgi:hypothetical protein